LITSVTFDDISPAYLTILELKRLINFLDEVNVACTFFVVPYEEECRSSDVEEFASCLRVALDKGHELALHGYRHTKNEFGVFYPIPLPIPFPTFKRQKDRIRKGKEKLLNLIGVTPEGFRAPYYLHNSNTWKALASSNFKYDSSVTIFKPTHCSRFRVQWVRSFRPFLTNGIVEIPVAGDYTYNLGSCGFSDSLKMAMRDFELVKSSGGIFVINNHPNLFQESEFQFLRTLINKIRTRSTFLRLIDVAQSLLDKSRENCR